MNFKPNDTTGLLRHGRGSLYSFWGLALLIAAIYSLLSFLTPYYLDDWTFMGNWRDDAANSGFSISGWWKYYLFIRGYDNGRIANAMSPISTMFSPWKELFPIFTGCLAAAVAILLQRLATGRRSAAFLSFTWALMIIGLPWHDTLFVRDYSLNYIWAAALTLAFLFSLKHITRSPGIFGLSILLAFLAGGWHEGFAVPSLCGLGLLMLVRRFRLPARFYIATAVYLASTLLFMLSPGLISRAVNEVSRDDNGRLLLRPLVIIVLDAILFTILFCRYLFKNSDRSLRNLLKILGSPVMTVAGGIVIAGFAIGLLTVNTSRSYFWPDMGAIAIGIHLLNRILPDTGRWKLCRQWAAVVITLACVAQSVAVIIWQSRYAHETEEIMALLDKSPSGTVFYDTKLPEKAPAYTLGIPVDNAWRNPYHYRALWSYYITPVIGVVPTSLRTATKENSESDTLGLRIPDYIDGEIVYPFVSESGDTLLYRTKN